ncbi:hypothetical protein OROHE_013105 [Orobanche hederae]
MAASSHFLTLTPKTLSPHHSSFPAAASALFTPTSPKPQPRIVLALSSIKKKYAHPTSRFVRKVSFASELEVDVEEEEEEEEEEDEDEDEEEEEEKEEEDDTLDFSGPEEPSFAPDLKLFVGNLPFSVDSATLAGLFQQAGGVETVEVIYDKATGRSRGFGFVTMSRIEEAEAAAQKFNGYELEGRALRVNSGPPPPKRENGLFRGFRGPEGMSSIDTNKLHVGNLSWDVDNLALETLFSEQGNVKEARVVYDRESGRSRGFGFVTYSSPEEVNNAIEVLNGTTLTADLFELVLLKAVQCVNIKDGIVQGSQVIKYSGDTPRDAFPDDA